MTRTQVWVRATTLITLVAAASGGGLAYVGRRDSAPAVTTVTVTRGDIIDTISATGTVEALTRVEVGTQVSGTVKDLLADFNSIVHKGQILARLDPALFETQVEQARANVIRAESEVDRVEVGLVDARSKLARSTALAARQLLAASELESADVAVRSAEAQVKSTEAALTQARASLNQAEVNLDHTVILSPIDGIVISRNVDVGQTVAASMQAPTLFVLAADLTQMRVSASLDESDVGRVAAGQPVTFRVDAYPAESFSGTVTQVRLQAVVTQNVVTYVTVVDCQNPDLKLKPGMTASVTIEVARRTDVLRVPASALRYKPSSDVAKALGSALSPAEMATKRIDSAGRTGTLWISDGGQIAAVEVETGIFDGTMTEIVDGAVDVGSAAVTAISLGTPQTSAKTASTTTRSPLLSTGGPPPGGMPPPR